MAKTTKTTKAPKKAAKAKVKAKVKPAAVETAVLQKAASKKAIPQNAASKKAASKKAVSQKAEAKQILLKPLRAIMPQEPVVLPPPASIGASPVVLERLWSVIMSRRTADPAVSHSARLLSRGTAKIAQKFGEEAVECLIEATRGDRRALIAESADVLYHMLVMWVDAGVQPSDVWAELQRREGVSGIAEKASRPVAEPLRMKMGTAKIP